VKVITYRVTLLEPTLVTALEGDPNSAVAFDYLPGSVLRGVIIDKYCRQLHVADLAENADARRLFFDGTTRYLNGYPLDRLDERSLPTPLSWQRKKGEETRLYDFAAEVPDEKKQWQSVSVPFCALTDEDVRLVQPDRHITVHTARNRRFGRPQDPRRVPDEDPGAIYRYDALAAEQTFEAAVVCDNDADAAILRPLLSSEATIGRSRSGGYGRVLFEHAEETPADWNETGQASRPGAAGKCVFTLLSDALLRDRHGQYVVDARVVTDAFSEKLGVPLRLYEDQTFLRGREIGGFNRKWSLPLPQALAVHMGSVFVYDPPACAVDKLHELEVHGIGERRAEGFGRIAVNWHGTQEQLKVDPTLRSVTVSPVVIRTGMPIEKVARRMAERLLRQRLDEQLVARANSVIVTTPPSNAQLSRLRNIIHHELMQEAPNLQRIGDFLDDIKQRATARKQFERARIGGTRLSDWLDQTRQRTSENDWQSLWGFDRQQDVRTIGGVGPSFTDTLHAEYVLRFIDAVLAHAAKAKRKEA
jgi:CRISPR-associated protein Csx10